MSRKTVKVAVIGSGLAGLTTAYLVAEQSKDHDVHFDIHVFEKVTQSPTMYHPMSTIMLLDLNPRNGCLFNLPPHPGRREKSRMACGRSHAVVPGWYDRPGTLSYLQC